MQGAFLGVLSQYKKIIDFQISGFVRGFEINRFGPLKSMMDLGQIQIPLILSYPDKEFGFETHKSKS